MSAAALLAGLFISTADFVGAQGHAVRTAVWVENPDNGEVSFVPASTWYPDEAGVLITLDGRIGESGLRPDGYDPTGPREDSTFDWTTDEGGHDAAEGEVFIASGVDTDGEPFEFRYVHEEQTGPIIPALDWSTHPEHLRPPAYIETPVAVPALIVPFEPPAPPAPTPAPATETAPQTTTTAPAAPTTTAAPIQTITTTTTTTAPAAPAAPPAFEGERPIIVADANTVLDQPNTIYDFNNSSPGDVTIAASNVEARNIRGGGKRHIGVRNGQDIVDSGFRDFQFTFANVQIGGGGHAYRPYFINGTDVNGQPNVGDGDIMQMLAYEGDIHDPLVDNVTIYGKERPAGSDAHNDGLQIEGLSGNKVWNPTVRNSHIEGASNVAILIQNTGGLVTIENNSLSERFGGYFAVNGIASGLNPTILFRNNTLLNGSSATFNGGWTLHSSSNGLESVTVE